MPFVGKTPMVCYLQRLHCDDAIQQGNMMSLIWY